MLFVAIHIVTGAASLMGPVQVPRELWTLKLSEPLVVLLASVSAFPATDMAAETFKAAELLIVTPLFVAPKAYGFMIESVVLPRMLSGPVKELDALRVTSPLPMILIAAEPLTAAAIFRVPRFNVTTNVQVPDDTSKFPEMV